MSAIPRLPGGSGHRPADRSWAQLIEDVEVRQPFRSSHLLFGRKAEALYLVWLGPGSCSRDRIDQFVLLTSEVPITRSPHEHHIRGRAMTSRSVSS